MSTYTTEAREVRVGDILVDEDHVRWTVEDIDQTESFGPYRSTFGLQFLLARVETPTHGQDEERNESYDHDEMVTLDAQDEEGMPFDTALWHATAPKPDEGRWL